MMQGFVRRRLLAYCSYLPSFAGIDAREIVVSRYLRCFTTMAFVLFLSLRPAVAQTTFGSISGTVTDASGAVIPGAQVTVINEGTGMRRNVSTANDGIFTIPALDVGTYRLHVEAKGFSPQEKTGLVLFADNGLNVNFQLTVGATATQVNVTSTAPVMDMETTAVRYGKTGTELRDLPLTARQQGDAGVVAFAMYNPGVGVNDSGNFFANGVRQVDTYIANDGIVEMADPDGVGGTVIQPGLEAVGEVSYTLGNATAEYQSPVNFTTLTKSGGNQIHGSLYYDYNGNALNTRNFFSSQVPFRVYNDFAASVGGPIKKDKTFYFVDYEGSREKAQTVIAANTPLEAWRTGDFSGLLSQGVVLENPYTGEAFSNNQIPSGLLNSVSLKAQAYFYPLPNYGSSTLQSGNWRGLRPGQNGFTHYDDVDGRLDHNFSSKDVVFGRFSYRRLPVTSYGNNLPPVGVTDQLRTSSSAVFSWTHTLSPGVLNEFRAGYSRQNNAAHSNLVGSDIISEIGMEGIDATGAHGVPVFNISGITSTSTSTTGNSMDTNFQYIDDLSWVRGAHSFKFGGDIIRDQIGGHRIPNSVYGTYNFTGTYTGSAYADFLLGLPQTTGQTVPTPALYLRGTMWSFYAQDQFKVTRRLTVNYGVRWELNGPYYDRFGRTYSYDPQLGALVVPNRGSQYVNPLFPTSVKIVTATAAGYPNPALLDFHKRNIYPRLGFSYQLTSDGKTVIRGSYGIFGDTIYGVIGRSSTGGPYGGSETFYNSITDGVPLFSFPDPFVTSAGLVSAFQSVGAFNRHLTTPYTQQWNLTLERQIGTLGLSIAYLGTRSVNLIYPRNINQPAPSTTPFSDSELPNQSFSSIAWAENGASQDYNSLQIAATKKQGRNLTLSTGYTWARDLTDQQDNDWVDGQEIQNQFDRKAEWGNNLFTPVNRLYADVVYALPFGAQQRFLGHMSRLANGALGGWRIAGVLTLQSGQFFTPSFDGFDPSNTNNYGGRPDRVAGTALYPAKRTIANWFNAAAFKVPGCPDSDPVCSSPDDIGRFGNSGNDILQTPGMRNLDLALMKAFRVTEGKTLGFQVLAGNAFNHPNFGYPAADISSTGTVGQITSTNGNYLSGSGVTRFINFAMRFQF